VTRPALLATIEPIASLVSATDRLRASNDKLADELGKSRGSVPPSAPRLPVEPVTLTPERAKDIARALMSAPDFLAMIHLLPADPYVSPAEFHAFCRLATRGTK
jgi:hypothetical protein